MKHPPITNHETFFAEPVDPAREARALAADVICRLLLWMTDEPNIEDRGLRASAALYSIRPDLVDCETLERLGDRTGRTRQHVHSLVNSFRNATGLRT